MTNKQKTSVLLNIQSIEFMCSLKQRIGIIGNSKSCNYEYIDPRKKSRKTYLGVKFPYYFYIYINVKKETCIDQSIIYCAMH